MKFVKILLRVVLVLLALISLMTYSNVGLYKAVIAALGMLTFGFVATHPIGLDPENYKGYDLDLYRVGVFALAAAIFFGSIGLVVSSTMSSKIICVIAALVFASQAILKISKSKRGCHAA